MSVIGDEHVMLNHFFHHRMAAVFYMYQSFFIQFGPGILVLLRHQGKRTENIQSCHGLCRCLDPFDFTSYLIPDFTEQIIFQGTKLVLSI